jgi:predicted MPP superfamily phosphohydrolase
MFRTMKEMDEREPFDLFVHNGDYCGGSHGARSVKTTVDMFRSVFPDKPYVSTIGNHDLWYHKDRRRRYPSLVEFQANYEKIVKVFKEQSVHFLDEDGPFRINGWTFVGHCGWYAKANPNTNDQNFLPYGIEGDTHRFLYKKAQIQLEASLKNLTEADRHIVFASHFPVIRDGDTYFDDFSWSSFIGDFMQSDYGCRWFLNGHAHKLLTGPLRYECGSDYGCPRFHIIDIK